jgi:leucyl-tRNA synthetase
VSEKYEFRPVQEKWIPRWRKEELYATSEDPEKPKFYCLDFFPYPSGSGLSVGHMRNYIPTDVITRMKRMRGFNVLHPMGWDAFGLPAENYALKQGVHPRESTAANVANYKRQMGLAEISFDWTREVNSTDPAYYKWTQWFFGMLFQRGLAYQGEGLQWFCEQCPSVLANEQVVNGKCWRHDGDEDPEVQKRPMKQWYFKITDYAERLLKDLDLVDWPEHIKKMQQNWIGRSTGARLIFTAKKPDGSEVALPVYTTRPDTIYGATYMVIAPEHPLVDELTTEDRRDEVKAYIHEAAKKSEIERLAENKSKTGIFTGCTAKNPYTGENIPIWIGDYVLAHYGTGAIMSVPAHDTRDFAFAKKYDLPIRVVIVPEGGVAADTPDEAYVEDGVLVGSGPFNGEKNRQAIHGITEYGEKRGFANFEVNYKFRDWLISRQRYWGAPIPVIHCDACGPVLVPEKDLPVELPELEKFQPSADGRSPLGNCEDWLRVPCPGCGKEARRETDTMDGFACSSWYFLRFSDPHNAERAISQEKLDTWLPVDLYVGGAEHAVMHLLYARFWTKVMQDAGFVSFPEPFVKLRNQGMMLAADGAKMSKSKGNVVTPDEVEAKYGTDVLRAFILFLGSFESEVPWNPESIKGVRSFLEDIHSLLSEFPGTPREAGAAFVTRGEGDFKEVTRLRHWVTQKVTRDIENFSFNTAVSALMECKNSLKKLSKNQTVPASDAWSEIVETILCLLAPIAPFMAEELWEKTGLAASRGSVHRQSWPTFDEAYLKQDERLFPIQINGKVRDKVVLATGLPEAEVKAIILARPKVQGWIEGKEIKRFLVIKDRMISIAVK